MGCEEGSVFMFFELLFGEKEARGPGRMPRFIEKGAGVIRETQQFVR
jgi:hypothetical protein